MTYLSEHWEKNDRIARKPKEPMYIPPGGRISEHFISPANMSQVIHMVIGKETFLLFEPQLVSNQATKDFFQLLEIVFKCLLKNDEVILVDKDLSLSYFHLAKFKSLLEKLPNMFWLNVI